MIAETPGLLDAVRSRFAHVEACPFEGPRVFFENAGGALHLKSVVETSAAYASYPDNEGRDNAASRAMTAAVQQGRADMRTFLNAPDGEVMVGESGTEILFRLIRTAALNAPEGGIMLGSTLEHPASTSAMARWAAVTGRRHVRVAHDDATGALDVAAYAAAVTPETRVASIIHTSPVTGMATDVAGVAAAIRAVAPDCFIVVDGIQHASHGSVDVASYGVDGYAVSPYKMFSRHGYGVGWASPRLSAADREALIGSREGNWELGTRDAGSYATFSDVVDYLVWLGDEARGEAGGEATRRQRLEAGARAIGAQERALTDAMLHGTGNLAGLAEIPGVTLVGGPGVERREGVFSLALQQVPAADLVARLREQGIRVHIRKNDHYSGNVLGPLGLEACIRVSIAHYNTEAEVARFLAAMAEIAA
ncbi:MAG: aminotransferase class V-fold PLP-dependent enzyme [Pseudomonadota bacterium]